MSVQSPVKYCYRHPKEETRLSCGKCERPICTKCGISGPAGIRCRECASLRGSVIYRVAPWRLALAALFGLVTGTVGAVVLFYVGWFMFIIGPAYGVAVAEAVSRGSGRKVGPAILAIGIGSIVFGAIAAFGLRYALEFGALSHAAASASGGGDDGSGISPGEVIEAMLSIALWPLVGIGLAVSTCYARLRYL